MTKDHHANHKSSSKLQQQWNQPHHILLVIIVMQLCFMIFMGLQGPSGSQSNARVSPHHHNTQYYDYADADGEDNNAEQKKRVSSSSSKKKLKKKWKSEVKSASQDRQEKLQLRIQEAAKKTLPSLEAIKKRQDELKQQKANKTIKGSEASTVPPRYKSMLQRKEWEVNTREFPGAVHLHFAKEQQEPSFRTSKPKKTTQQLLEKYVKAEKEDVPKLMVKKSQKIESCYYYHEKTQQLLLKEWCFNVNRKGYKGLLVYNPLPFERTWCGKAVPPNSIQHHARICKNAYTEPARIMLPDSDKMLGTLRRDLKNLPPIVLKRVDSYGSVEPVPDCDVPCKASLDTCVDEAGTTDLKGTACLPEVSDWTVEGTDFKFRYSMLDPRLAPVSLWVSRKGYRENQFYATRSFQSEIPLSTFDWERYGEMNTPHNDHRTGKKGLAFIHMEPCQGEIRPGVWSSKIQEEFKGPFDYYGPCNFGPNMRPTETKLDLNNYQDRQTIMAQYMFTLIIGHSRADDVITDFVWDALTAGSLPVYYGAPNIREHVPPNSIIVADEYSNQAALAEYLNKLKVSRPEWLKLHAWRDKEESTSLIEQKYGFLKEPSSSSYCRMCRWALATKYSMGWDHSKQTIERPVLDRKFCVSPKDELKFPVEEFWLSDLGTQRPGGRRICETTGVTQTFEFDDLAITRTVTSHDNGVVDIAITDIKSLAQTLKIVLRLNIRGLSNAHGGHIIQPHQILYREKSNNPSDNIPLMSSIALQDDKTRATIITNWATDVTTPKTPGMVDILVKDLKNDNASKPRLLKKGESATLRPRLKEDEVLKIRIIIEDVNHLRDAHTEYNLSPYARLLVSDFLDPLMVFAIE